MESGGYLALLFTVTLCLMKTVAFEKKEIEASFYGESYAHSSFKDATQSFIIKLEFKSARPDGLLFLALGKTDYLLVQLNAGTIETRTNLGSGEAVVFSARGVRLDDSKWHRVEITCNQGLVYLSIDGRGQGQSTTPGKFYELNIELGIYTGGKGNFEKPYVRGSMRPYRGCLRGVYFNKKNVLRDAQNAFHVSWSCDDEFTATTDSVISLSDETSFAALPSFRIYPSSTGVLSCDVKTRSSDVLLLFNSGQGSTSKDFIAVELVNGKPKLSMDKGSGLIDIALQTPINDGIWHTLVVTISETSAKIQVDTEQNVTTFHFSGQNYLNLGHHLYIGGLGNENYPQASKLGLSPATGMLSSRKSLLGCVRNVSMNLVKYGFPEIQISRNIDVGCRWQFSCSQNPCIETALCVETGMKEFRCECDQAICVKSEFQQHNAADHISSILSVKDLEVSQGGTAVINTDIIQIKQEYKDYFMRENILFVAKEPPTMGTLEVHRVKGQNSFTWSDFLRNSVNYQHYGDSSSGDTIVFEILIERTPFTSTVLNKYNFILPVRVIPVTPFQVRAPNGQVLAISPGGRMQITTSILNVETNTDPSMIAFQVTFLREAASYFEKMNSRTNIFTFKDIENGDVWFQHKEDDMVYTKINITDKVKHITEAVQLRFRRQNFDLNMENNTGILMGYGSSISISSQNLSFTAGSKLEEVEVRYEITRPPSHGVLQLYSDTSNWIDVQNFTQEEIDSGKVRYQHFPDDSFSTSDSFKFYVISKEKITAPKMFRIRFKTVVLTVENKDDLVIHKGSFSRLSNSTLLVLCNAENLDFNNIVYTVITAPHKGRLYQTKRPISSSYDFDLEPSLKTDDTFSQMDVNRGFVYYKYNNPSIKKDTDYMDLEASYFGYTIRVRTLVIFSPGNLGVKLINNGLTDVLEGGLKVISKQNFFVEADKFKDFTFTVSEGPFHGSLNLVDSKTLRIINSKISSFVTAQLVSGKVAYKHDDSENSKDLLKLIATPNIQESASNLPDEIEQLAAEFHISIRMRNDNPPERVINKVFRVVTGQFKTLTLHDLAFHDPDIDFDDSLLEYQRHEIPNGDFLDKITNERVFNFTQKDLINSRLMFKHRGESFSRVPILVSDGQFFSNSILEIRASKPFLQTEGSLILEVESGEAVVLDKNTISVESNLDFKPEDVTMRLENIPKHGTLQVNGNTNADFSFKELMNGHVKYHHRGLSVMSDSVNLAIILKDFTTKAQVNVKITSSDTTGPPEIVNNQVFSVDARQIQVITNQYLKAQHKGYLPQDINFIITGGPQHGHLIIRGRPVKAGSAPEFSQDDINKGHIVYASDSPIHLSDKFTFDVGTELESLRDMEFLIEVIPETALTTHLSFTVDEGGRITFNSSFFKQFNLISQSGRFVFNIEQAPMHGKVVSYKRGQDHQVRSFSAEDLQQKRVSYIHDGSESHSDILAIKASPRQPNSHPGEILQLKITVKPVDDQPPKVIVNSGLDLWSGSLALVTGRQLQALDPDTSSADIEYMVTSRPSNGHLAFLSNTFRPINSFTQLDLDSEHVVFVHKGAVSGSFTLRVSDGKNQGGSVTVAVQARPVTIAIVNLRKLHAFPRQVHPITNLSLLADVSASNFSDPIIFTLRSPRPLKGRLVTRSGIQIVEITSFTQNDVNHGKVFYQHTGFMVDWQESEQLVFDVSTTYAQTLRNKVLKIDIAFSNINDDNYRDLLKIKAPHVAEGGKIFINRNNFDSSEFVRSLQRFNRDIEVHFSFESYARYGWLWYKDEEFEKGQEFTQADLNSQLLVYKHDDTDSTHDKFQFKIKILVPRAHDEKDRSVARLFNFTLIIDPVNDNGHLLLTHHPTIAVLQGSEIVVTRQNLTTVDIDTGPEDIEYTIVTQPDNGMFVHVSAPRFRLHKFSQLDINTHKVVFKHDGSSEERGSMYFKVSDKKFTPTYANLGIEVHLVGISITAEESIPIVQGINSITITSKDLGVSTNGDLSKMEYLIVRKTHYGRLTMHGKLISSLSQQDLEQGRLKYTQNSDSQGSDFFELTITLRYLNVSRNKISFFIEQKPLVKQGPLITADGSYVAITRASLDVSELAQLTNDDPQFSIEKAPRHGKIMIRRRQRRETGAENSFTPVTDFTFEDIIFTRIYYVPDRGVTRVPQDNFTYILSARGVPPALGELTINLDVNNDASGGITTKRTITSSTSTSFGEDSRPAGGKDRSTVDGDDNAAGKFPGKTKSNKNNKSEVEQKPSTEEEDQEESSTVIIIVVIIILCLVLVAVVAIVLLMRKRRAQQRSAKTLQAAAKPRPLISGPLQLEQTRILAQPETYIREEDNNSSAPMISSPSESHPGEHIALVSAPIGTSGNKSTPETYGLYVNTAHVKDSKDHGAAQASGVTPDVTQVTTVLRARPESESAMSEDTGERQSTVTSGRGSSATSDLIDWNLMDPDLLQSCNQNTPALRNNQYWL